MLLLQINAKALYDMETASKGIAILSQKASFSLIHSLRGKLPVSEYWVPNLETESKVGK